MKQVRSQAKHVKRYIVYIHATNKLDNVDSDFLLPGTRGHYTRIKIHLYIMVMNSRSFIVPIAKSNISVAPCNAITF